MKAAEPRFVIPSRNTFRDKLTLELYQEVMTKLKRELNAHMTSKSSISITTDAWASSTAASYTIHIIKADFTMASYNLGTFELVFCKTRQLSKLLVHSRMKLLSRSKKL